MPSDLTQLLYSIEQGDPQAAEELLPLVYEESRRLALPKWRRSRRDKPFRRRL